ncbi:MAG: inositol monophosphatase family protein [Actinomycetota bacterium]|jgi:myo-inositol-1(or 4)-monophosphatase|nr:inositol monophosphatase family protein [Actinomycetota bacterium]
MSERDQIPGMSELGELCELAAAVATEAGRILSSRFSAAGPTQEVTNSVTAKSSLTDPVSEADRASEQLIVGRLAATRPDDGVLAEESGANEGTSGLTWVVDPLDGTVNFLYGLPLFGVSIALRSRSATLVGVVHDPSRGETFTAIRGGGAYRDGVRLLLRSGPSLDKALVATGFSYDSGRRRSEADLLSNVVAHVRDIRRAGAAALDLCWVAAGRLDGFYEAGLAPWDTAAGALIVSEAGGTVEEVPGLLKDYPETPTLTACAPGLSAALHEILLAAREAAR